MSVSTLNTILTLTALALAGTAVSLAGPPLIYLGTWQSKTRNLLPAFITSVVAALLYLAIVDTTPWPASPEGVSIQLRGWVEFYGAGLLWALRVITLPLLFTAVTALIVLIFTATKLAHYWLTGHSDQTCAAYNVTRAEALRRAWRLRGAERRFARGLTSDLLGSATRKKRGAISWDRDPAFVDFATGFVMTPAADYYSISGYDIEDHIDRAEQRPEISTVELLTVDDCHDDPVPPSQSETMFIVRWNGEYLSRPLLPAATTAGTGAIFFGRWPLRDRIRRAASRPGGPAVIVGAPRWHWLSWPERCWAPRTSHSGTPRRTSCRRPNCPRPFDRSATCYKLINEAARPARYVEANRSRASTTPAPTQASPATGTTSCSTTQR